MEKERTVRIKDLTGYVLKRWRVLLICMVIFAVLLNGYSCLKSYQSISETKNQGMQKEDFSQYRDKLSDKEILEVENAVESYHMYEESYADYKEYNINSIKMQIDANAVPTQKVIYQIAGNQRDVVNISDTFVEVIPGNKVCNDILEQTEWDTDVSYVKELISVANTHMDTIVTDNQNITDIIENNSSEELPILITVNIIADNQKNCEIIANAIDEEIGVVANDLKAQFGQFSVQKISDSYGVESNKDLLREQQNSVNEMNNSNNSMQTLENNLTDDQKSYFAALVNEEPELDEDNAEEVTEIDIPKVQYINKKYIIVGAALGVILCCFYAVCRFFLDKKLLSPNYVLDDLKSEVLLLYPDKQSVNKKCNVVDRWLDGIFSQDGSFCTGDDKLDILCANIQIFKEKNNLKKIHVSSSQKNENIESFISKVSVCLYEKNIDFSVGESIISNTESLEKFASADGVIFVEQLNQTLISEMSQELSLCEKYNVKNLGFVIIK